MSKPKGSKDAKKRKKRNEWTGKQQTWIQNNHDKYSIEELNKSQTAIKKLGLNGKSKSFTQDIDSKLNLDRNEDDIKLFLDRACKKLSYNIVDNCWEWDKKLNTKGYGAIRQCINGKSKDFIAHRVSYYKHYGQYPKLIRHKCHNKKCINPEHLEAGSYRQNSNDNFAEFNKEFEEVWLKYEGDRPKITEYFNWKPLRRLGYSISVLHHEIKLKLITKYPNVLRNKIVTLDSRGAKKKSNTGKIVGKWKCIESHYHKYAHLWECQKCGDYRMGDNTSVKNFTRCSCKKM